MRRMRRTQRRTTLLALVLALTCAGCDEETGPYSVSTEPARSSTPAARFELSAAAAARADVELAAAEPAVLARELVLPGSIGFDEEHRAEIVARLDGVVAEVHVRLGDDVEAGDLLATLQSRDLARARSAFIEAGHHLEFSRLALQREERLREKAISSEEDYLRAKHAENEARLALRMAGQELRALGVGRQELERLGTPDHAEDEAAEEVDLTRFELRAPMAGTIVSRSCVLGEAVRSDARLFEVADLSRVWVDLRIPASDLARLEVGGEVRVASRALRRELAATLDYLDPRVDANTQTALGRVVLTNEGGAWRPGLFVAVHAVTDRHEAALAVPVEAVHHHAERPHVFVALGGGRWEAREVGLGARDEHRFEVLSGLRAGEEVATRNALVLKSAWLGQGGEEE